jgi:hypothetical protein
MKVKELIQLLNCYGPETEVHIGYTWPDYWRTKVAPSVHDVSEGQVLRDSLHGFTLIEDDERDGGPSVVEERDEKTISVVVIR